MENEEMKDRIAHIIRAKNMTAAEFAIKLGIQPSNVSHLLSGRNNPSLDFVRKLKETFPEYNTDWIIFGKGPMTISEPIGVSSPLLESKLMPVENGSKTLDGTLFAPMESAVLPEQPLQNDDPTLQKMVLVYSDHTFEVLLPC